MSEPHWVHFVVTRRKDPHPPEPYPHYHQVVKVEHILRELAAEIGMRVLGTDNTYIWWESYKDGAKWWKEVKDE